MEVTHIPATEATSSVVPVWLARLPSATFAPIVSLQVGYFAADSQTGFWQSTVSDDTPPAGPQGGVHALFNLDVKTEAPFPTNWFTVSDRSNLTNRRVHLPLPDCKVFVSDCEDLNVINQLDGFNLQPRLSIPFDGPIDVNSVNSQDVMLINLGDTVDGREHGDHVVGINQIVWDPDTNALHVESDQLLDQHTRYALIVTNGIQDVNGNPVQASEAFRSFPHNVHGEYRHELLDAIHAARRLGIRERDIVDASVFSTESATAIMEKMRDQIHTSMPAPANFLLGPNGERTVFARDDVKGITFHEQTEDDPPGFTDAELSLAPLDIFGSVVSEIAFGKYVSPDYEVHPGEYIPQVGTRTGTPAVQGMNDVYFTLYLPSGPRPKEGWPVAYFGHGGGATARHGQLPLVAATMAEHGIATIGINAVGYGFGPLSALTVNRTAGQPVTFLAGGRSFDQDHDGHIEFREGELALAPRAILADTDAQRQDTADIMQLVRVIQVGIDVHGDGSRDLDPSRIYYVGGSLSGFHGAVLLAVEPDVRVGALNVTGGPRIEGWRLDPFAGFRSNRMGSLLAARQPPRLNSPGVTEIDGISLGGPFFDENLPLRNGVSMHVRLEDGTSRDIQSPVINHVPGTMALQEFFDNTAWVQQPSSPPAHAPHFHKNPLPGVPAKSVLYQFPKGDESMPNPLETATVRAGDLADRTTYYRHDLAYAGDPTMPKDPHAFYLLTADPNGNVRDVARGYQEQIATFFESNGKTIIHPEPARFFEVPIQGPLPEELNWIP
jgi:hypothetical protein